MLIISSSTSTCAVLPDLEKSDSAVFMWGVKPFASLLIERGMWVCLTLCLARAIYR